MYDPVIVKVEMHNSWKNGTKLKGYYKRKLQVLSVGKKY